MRFERLSIEEGLSQSVVKCILQDSTGFLWLGTQAGLNRYDGYGFEVYRHDPRDPSSLAHDWVNTLVEDPSGDLWVGTEGGGLAHWRRATDTFQRYRHDISDPDSLSGNRIAALAIDRAGTLWIGTLDAGLNRLAIGGGAGTAADGPALARLRHDPNDPHSLADDRVNALYVDRSGNLWVGTQGGLDRFDAVRQAFVHFRHDPADPRSLTDDRVRVILEDAAGDLWVGTEKGLNRFVDGGFERFLHDPAGPGSLSHDWVRTLLQDDSGRLWVGTDGGLNLWQEADTSFVSYHPDPGDPDGLGSDQVVALYQDSSGMLWISTVGTGLSKWNPRTWSFPHYVSGDEGGESKAVFAISENPDGVLWIGTFGGGLERLDRATGKSVRFTHDPRDPASLGDDRLTALLHDSDRVLWVGTVAGGLHRFSPLSGSPAAGGFERYRHDPARSDSLAADAVSALYEDRRRRLWIGTYGGGLDLYRGGGVFTHFRHDPQDATSIANDRVFAMAEDHAGLLWVATDGGGLNRFHPATGAFLRLEHDPAVAGSLSSNELLAVHVDGAGRLWAGTKGRGLDRLVELDEVTGRAVFRRYSRQDGLPDETIWSILSDAAGMLWLATNKGLARFDPEAETVKVYTTAHGLQSNEFNQGAAYASPRGELFFGGVNGLNAFFPDRIEAARRPPPIVVTAFTKANRPVRFDRPLFDVEEVALDHHDYFFTLEFAALDFTAPEQNRYRYKLEGFDLDWVDLGHHRRATFTNLDAGQYTLRLEGANHDGVWNEEGASLRIAIAPPPWQSWWAYALYALAAAAVVGGYMRHQRSEVERERAIAQRERAQSEERRQLLEERGALIDELEAKNAELERFNYTVSHDLKSPLVTIKGFLGLLQKDAESGDLERLRHDVRRIAAAADRMRKLLDELLVLSTVGRQVRPPEEVRLTEVAHEALEIVAGQVAERGAEVVIETALPVIFGDRLRLMQLYQNLLANAVKYMGDQRAPRVEVGVRRGRESGGEDVLFVRDNGSGIDERYHEKVFGLFERLDAADEGTGVGLALAKRIVEMHGGRIWVESDGAKRGSTFCFTLVRARAAEGGAAELTEPGTVLEAGHRFRSSVGD